jgi:hypothetical protein
MSARSCLIPSVLLLCAACAPTPPPVPAAGSGATATAEPVAPASAPSGGPATSAPGKSAPWFEGCLSPELVAATTACRPEMRAVPFDVLAAAQGRLLRRPAPKAPPPSTSKDPKVRFAPIPFDAEEQEMLALRRDFVCTSVFGDVVGFVDTKMSVLYDLGRTYFEKNRFEEAAVIFRGIALDAPEPAMEAPYAAQLFLEALNVLAAAFEKPGCMSTLRAQVPIVQARLCGPPPPADRTEVCSVLSRIRTELDAKKPAP